MKWNNKMAVLVALSLYIFINPVFSYEVQTPVDHSLYATLLHKYVRENRVDYRGIQKEEAILDQYLKILENTDTRQLDRNERFAFYINAYNAWTIKLVLTRYPSLKSIKDIGTFFRGPWKQKIVRIDGKVITLNDLEHGILRPRFQDARVHFAVNCASVGCPPLRSEPYRGDRLDRQLDDQVESFVNNPKQMRLENNTLYVNRVFKWFGEDFKQGAVPFVRKYATGDLKKKLDAAESKVKVKYLPWDWALNDVARH